jgi:hypothetical protein
MAQVIRRYGDCPEDLAIVGVDLEDHAILYDHADWLKSLAWFSTRSAQQSLECNEILGADKTKFHPDLVFSLLPTLEDLPPRSDTVIGFNLCPVSESNSAIYAFYAKLVQKIAQEAIEAGYHLRHFSFTPEDTEVAEKLLAPMGCELVPFHASPNKRLREVATCKAFFAARYHSLIYSLITRTPVFPYLYAPKCYRLMKDLMPEAKLPPGCTEQDLAQSYNLYDESLLQPGEEMLLKWKASARGAIMEAYSRLVRDSQSFV